MGIQGLLPLLKDIQRKVSVSDFFGKVVGIDGYCWLHKGVYGCAKDVVEGRKTNVYINYVLKRINMLLGNNIKPVMVFDGGYLPAKASKEKERRGLREENLKKAKALLRAGSNSQAYECFQRCVEITPAMATEVIQACRAKNVLCIVAPYEADAQLAYLEMQGITDFTITEDSDLLIYGCKKVLFKMNSDGDGIFINLDDLNKVKTVALETFTMEKFRHMCILSGCDYLPSIKGLGLYKAHKYLRKSSNVVKAIQLIKQEKKLKVPDDYVENFRKTDAVFKYQSVFDPRSKKVVRLNEVSEHEDISNEELAFAGPEIDESKAIKIALGNIDPISGETLADFAEFLNKPRHVEPPISQQTFVESPSKPRNPKLRYSLEDSCANSSNSDQLLKEEYLHGRGLRNGDYGDNRDTDDDNVNDLSKTAMLQHFPRETDDDFSPPEKSLRNIHLHENANSSSRPSIGILYEDKGFSMPAASKFGHHSVFVKRKRHKLKNPFRVHEDDSDSSVNLRSRYFSSEGSASGTENDAHSEILSMMNPESDSGAFYTTGENSEDALRPLESPPEPKRVKLGSINNSDFLWRTSLKSHSSKLLGGEESSSLNVHQDSKVKESIKPRDSILKAEDCQTAVNKPKSVYESCTLSTNQDGVGLERSELAAVYKATSLKLSPPIVDTPRLPCFSTSLTDEEDQRQQFTFGLMPFSLGNNVSNTGDRRYSQLQKRVSLFKYAKAKNTKCQTEQISSQENNLDSENRGSSMDENKASSLHLQTRSFSEPNLRRSSSSKTLSVLGKCKKIGLSRRSRSSLDRVREKDAKLTQIKIGFERFAYSKKSIKTKDSSDVDVVFIN